MICVYENLVVPDAVDANVCPQTTSRVVIFAAKHEKTRTEVSPLPASGDLRFWGSSRASETVVFIQVSVISNGLGSGQC